MPASQPFTRTVRQPGKPDPVRIASLEGAAIYKSFTLQAGRNLHQAICIPLAEAGIAGGTVRFENLRVAPHHFLMPALPVDDQHAAFYSAPHAIEEGATIEYACATYGRKDDLPFVHCHAVWRGRDGEAQGGHLLPERIVVAASGQAEAWGLHDATMATRYDPETNFTLFHPTRLTDAAPARDGKRVVLARIRPEEDLTMAIEEVCRSHGIASAVIRGSVGSLIGADFEDGRVLQDRATEILVRSGEVRDGPQGLRARLEIALINPQGKVCEGVLGRGRNPVLICFELVIEER
jgi:predicted DNA-binding protein with PD1-like motif